VITVSHDEARRPWLYLDEENGIVWLVDVKSLFEKQERLMESTDLPAPPQG
jgi:hypothetical protein